MKTMNFFYFVLLTTCIYYISAECGDGICEGDENCLTCSIDCISGTSGGSTCGNDICENGETCFTCPADCNGSLNDDSQEKYCCHGGPDNVVSHAVSCEDPRCGGDKCNLEESSIVHYCCGDGVCNGEETYFNCEVDSCESSCGNGICDASESVSNCPMDCKCNLDSKCDEWEDTVNCPLDCSCGNKKCDADLGETVSNCPSDCGCNANYNCEPDLGEDESCPMDCTSYEGVTTEQVMTGQMNEDILYKEFATDYENGYDRLLMSYFPPNCCFQDPQMPM
jgi:hypothetical protein